jgi:hypothetical protein
MRTISSITVTTGGPALSLIFAVALPAAAGKVCNRIGLSSPASIAAI